MVSKKHKKKLHNQQPHKKKKLKVKVKLGYLYIKCSLKNTIITFKNKNNFLYQTSSKASKFKHKRKNNAYVIKRVSDYAARFIKNRKYNHLLVHIKGVGPGRYNVLKAFSKKKIQTLIFQERTSTPFNGCKKRKVRR